MPSGGTISCRYLFGEGGSAQRGQARKHRKWEFMVSVNSFLKIKGGILAGRMSSLGGDKEDKEEKAMTTAKTILLYQLRHTIGGRAWCR